MPPNSQLRTNTVEISLCGTGHFNYYSNSTTVGGSQGTSMYGQDKGGGQGTWDIKPISDTKATLLLQFDNGQTMSLDMLWDNGKTFLNGDRYYRTTAADGADYAPLCN